jgi:hypothetical protein
MTGELGLHVGGEILDGDYFGAGVLLVAYVFREQDFDIQPLVCGVAQTAVVQVVPVDIDYGAQKFFTPDMKKPPGGGLSAPGPV